MAGLEFSAPYNNDPETLEEILQLKDLAGNRIREIYLSGPQEYAGSGRITPKLTLKAFLRVVERIHREGIRVNLVVNATCEGTQWYSPRRIEAFLEYMRLVHLEHGVEAVTVANPFYLRILKSQFPNLEITASVLADIDCVQRASIYSSMGADLITPDANINRDLGLLERIRNCAGIGLKLMVNEGCLYKCPFGKFHFNYISHKSRELGEIEGDAFFANCLQVTLRDPSQILKSGWIRPEDLEKYGKVSRFFKIVGRARPKSMVIRTIRAYMEQRWDGDLLDIVSSSLNRFTIEYGAYLNNKSLDEHGFFEKVTTCRYQCDHCGYCQNLAQDLIRFRVLTRGKLEDVGLKEAADELERAGKLPPQAPRG